MADALGHGPPQRPHDEVLLAADAAEVGGGVGAPATVDVLLVLPGPHVCQRLLRTQRDAAGLLDREAGAAVAGWVLEPHLDAVDRIDEVAEAREVDLHVVVDRSEEHTSELHSLMRISYAVFC